MQLYAQTALFLLPVIRILKISPCFAAGWVNLREQHLISCLLLAAGLTLGPSVPGVPGRPLGPCRPWGPAAPLSPGKPRSPWTVAQWQSAACMLISSLQYNKIMLRSSTYSRSSGTSKSSLSRNTLEWWKEREAKRPARLSLLRYLVMLYIHSTNQTKLKPKSKY